MGKRPRAGRPPGTNGGRVVAFALILVVAVRLLLHCAGPHAEGPAGTLIGPRAAAHPATAAAAGRACAGAAAYERPTAAVVAAVPHRFRAAGADPSLRPPATARTAPAGDAHPAPWGRCDIAPRRSAVAPSAHGTHAARGRGCARAGGRPAAFFGRPAWSPRGPRGDVRHTPAHLQVFRC